MDGASLIEFFSLSLGVKKRAQDLWGPMAFTLVLAVLLSFGSAKPSSTFSLVFALVSVGAITLTINAVLLGGTIGFFQVSCYAIVAFMRSSTTTHFGPCSLFFFLCVFVCV